MCLCLYNSLPKSVQCISNKKTFKTKINKIVLELEPYSLSDYLNSGLQTEM